MATAETLINQGDNFFREGDYLKAAGLYMKASKKDPENAELHCNLSYALLKECKYLKALDAADKAAKLSPDMEQAHYRKGLALAALERWEESIHALMEAQRLQPSFEKKEVADMIAMAKWQCKKAHQEADTPVPEIAADAKRPEEPKKEEEASEEGKELSEEEKRKKLAAILAANQQKRTKKHNKKVMHKLAAEATAEKNLVTKQMLEKAKTALAKDQQVQSRVAELATNTKLEETKVKLKEGEPLTYDSERVARFATTELKGLSDAGERESFKEPVAVLLPGVFKEGWGDEGQGVSLWDAFSGSENHKHMVKFLANFVEKSSPHAVMVVCPKEKVHHPTLWTKDANKPFEEASGYVVQMVAKDAKDNSAWFVELPASLPHSEGTVHKLEDPKEWSLIPNVFLQEVRPASVSSKGNSKKNKKNRKAMSQVNTTTN